MKKDLLAGGLFVLLAALGLGGVLLYTAWTLEASAPTTIPPRPEPIATFSKKSEPPKKEPATIALVSEKKPIEKTKPELKKDEEPPKVVAKSEPFVKKEGPPPAPEIKVEPKKDDRKRPAATPIVLGNITKLNHADGEYAVKPLHGGAEIILLGKIRKLTIASLDEKSILDATGLEAEEIVFTGNINGGARALFGKAQTLTVREINDQSLLDASNLEARRIDVTGSINGRSTLKLHAPNGSIEFRGEINDHAQIDIAAPDGKVLFTSKGDSLINGNAKLTIVTRDLELRGAINSANITVTFTRDGSLKFRRLNGGARLLYSKADARDPAPRTEKGEIDARAVLREMPAGRK